MIKIFYHKEYSIYDKKLFFIKNSKLFMMKIFLSLIFKKNEKFKKYKNYRLFMIKILHHK